MIFFKKQHEEIALGFLKRIDLLLRSGNKSVVGYSIDKDVETLKIKIGETEIEMRIEGGASARWPQDEVGPSDVKPELP